MNAVDDASSEQQESWPEILGTLNPINYYPFIRSDGFSFPGYRLYIHPAIPPSLIRASTVIVIQLRRWWSSSSWPLVFWAWQSAGKPIKSTHSRRRKDARLPRSLLLLLRMPNRSTPVPSSSSWAALDTRHVHHVDGHSVGIAV